MLAILPHMYVWYGLSSHMTMSGGFSTVIEQCIPGSLHAGMLSSCWLHLPVTCLFVRSCYFRACVVLSRATLTMSANIVL